MGIDRKPTRYAHSAGHTDVCYSQNGDKLITCGTDGDIRIWSGFDDYDPVQTCVGEWSLCVRQKNDQIQIGTDNNNLQLLTYPGGERNGILTRFTAHVNHMAVGKNHNFIAIAAEDMEVKVINLTDPKEITPVNFTGLTGPPLSVALCPNSKTLAVSSGDGFLRLWDVETQGLLKEFNCVPKTNSFMNAKLLCRMDFEPNFSKYLAYPENNAIVMLKTSDWSTTHIKSDAIEASYSIVQFSPCGNYIAAASDKGDIVIWEVATQSLVDATSNNTPTAICALVWNPSGNGELAYCDVQGQFGIVSNCTSSEQSVSDVGEKGERDNDVDFGDVQFEDDDDDDNENAISLEKLKNDIMGTQEPELEFDKESSAPTPRPRTPEVPLQSTFMPSSTPEHLNPRYLCWNEIGVVRSYGSEEEEGQRSIEVEFHDSTFHNSMMMQNFLGYSMGSICGAALAVANANQITVVPLMSGTKEWNLTVDEDLDIVCIAASYNLICFATSNYSVHVCTIFGTQKAVLSVPGPVIAMSAFGCLLLIAYHSASARKDDQCINMMLIKLEGTSIVNRNITSALSPECSLFWLGFSDVGSPAVYDSNGLLYLFPLDSNLWLPFCDTRRHRTSPSDGFFVTAVFESTQTVRGIRCRGAIYPGFTPRPMLLELPLQPTFVEMSTEKSQLEANIFTWSTLQVENVDKKLKETALKTFALACKNNLDQRALELVEMLANPQILSLVMKYATKLNRRRLAEKLQDLASKIDNDETYNDEQNDVSVVTPSNIIRPNRKLVLTSSKLKSSSKLANVTTPVQSRAESASLSTQESFTTKTNISETSINTQENSKNNISDISINTQESLFTEEEPKNPFLKSLKKPKAPTYNPLSLTDKFAGFDEKKENKISNEGSEKRKKPDTTPDSDKGKEKQRKLDKFMFSKKN